MVSFDFFPETSISLTTKNTFVSLSWSKSPIQLFQNKLKPQQKDKVRKFIQITQTSEQTAILCLQQNDWKLEIASDNYFQNPSAYYRELDRKKVEQLFLKYRDPHDPQKVNSDGVIRFLEDLNLSPECVLVLIIAWKFRAEKQCEFSRNEFIEGFVNMSCDSLDKLKMKLLQLEKELVDQIKFKDLYQFTFNYAKEPGQKSLELETAIIYWGIVLKGRFKFLELWNKFLTVSILFSNNCLLKKFDYTKEFVKMSHFCALFCFHFTTVQTEALNDYLANFLVYFMQIA